MGYNFSYRSSLIERPFEVAVSRVYRKWCCSCVKRDC